jgi:hypothetical protein
MCAFDKNPKIPMLVINISIMTAIVRYVLIKNGADFQFMCNQTADVSLPTSSTDPMIIIGITALAKIATSPTML